VSCPEKVWFYTLGCRVNQYETDAVRELFLSEGYEETQDARKADVCVVNTCTVTAEAGRKSLQHLRSVVRSNPEALIVAMGCASQLFEGEMPADIILGTRDKNEIIDKIKAYKGDKSHNTYHEGKSALHKDFYHDFGTVVSPEGCRAFMKIQDGCDRFCTYCIIPYARGPVSSRAPESILSEARELTSEGFSEIIVSGIEICSYGKDMGRGIDALSEVLVEMSKIPGIERIRLGSLEPSALTEEFIDGLSGIKQICPHFHLSLQSGSDGVLKRMKRRYDTALYLEKVRLLRDKFPRMQLSTDIICGFPGESDKEFDETLKFVQEAGINRIHVFPYSVRQGTPAARMPQVPGNIAKDRVHVLSEYSDRARELFAESFKEKEVSVLAEEFKTDENGVKYLAGYTREYVYSRVYGDFGEDFGPGSIIDVAAYDSVGPELICRL